MPNAQDRLRLLSHLPGGFDGTGGDGQVAHLPSHARLKLAVQVKVRARQSQHMIPSGSSQLTRVEPDITQQIQHDRRTVQPWFRQGQTRHGAHLQIKLGEVAGLNAIVPTVVRPGRHFVNHQTQRAIALLDDEELDTQDANVTQRLGNRLRRLNRAGTQVGI